MADLNDGVEEPVSRTILQLEAVAHGAARLQFDLIRLSLSERVFIKLRGDRELRGTLHVRSAPSRVRQVTHMCAECTGLRRPHEHGALRRRGDHHPRHGDRGRPDFAQGTAMPIHRLRCQLTRPSMGHAEGQAGSGDDVCQRGRRRPGARSLDVRQADKSDFDLLRHRSRLRQEHEAPSGSDRVSFCTLQLGKRARIARPKATGPLECH